MKPAITEMPKIIVAIDGYSSSGKSTMARELAKRVGYIYIDSGAMYRAVTLFALRGKLISDENEINKTKLLSLLPSIKIEFQNIAGSDGIQHLLLNGEDVEKEIRTIEVSRHVSSIAEIPEVREQLVTLQKSFGEQKGIVMDGRDIGTTVFPQAELKIFVNASTHERARRRWRELQQKGMNVRFEEVLQNLEERDRLDTTREVSPLIKAEDAIEFDNGAFTHEEQMDWLMQQFQEKTENIKA